MAQHRVIALEGVAGHFLLAVVFIVSVGVSVYLPLMYRGRWSRTVPFVLLSLLLLGYAGHIRLMATESVPETSWALLYPLFEYFAAMSLLPLVALGPKCMRLGRRYPWVVAVAGVVVQVGMLVPVLYWFMTPRYVAYLHADLFIYSTNSIAFFLILYGVARAGGGGGRCARER